MYLCIIQYYIIVLDCRAIERLKLKTNVAKMIFSSVVTDRISIQTLNFRLRQLCTLRLAVDHLDETHTIIGFLNVSRAKARYSARVTWSGPAHKCTRGSSRQYAVATPFCASCIRGNGIAWWGDAFAGRRKSSPRSSRSVRGRALPTDADARRTLVVINLCNIIIL